MRNFSHQFTTWITNWFNQLISLTPAISWKYQWVYGGLLIVFLLVGIGLIFWKKLYPTLKHQLSAMVWFNFFLGAILFFFRYQRIPLLGMDLWRFIQEIEIVIWILLILRYRLVKYPKEMISQKVVSYKSKYLPKAKTT